ncbi:hypothetical protein GW17_00042541 [Ensete ventricosum]|nr:hypothetical protein GW17_00042541 [Ensete ventricosum]
MAPRLEEQGQLQLLEREEDEEDDCFESIDKRKYLSARRLAFIFFDHKFASVSLLMDLFRVLFSDHMLPVLMLIYWLIKDLYPIDISRLIVRSDLLISRFKFIRQYALRSMESGISSLGIRFCLIHGIAVVIAQGINSGDIKKLQDPGIYTCNGLMMHTKKVCSPGRTRYPKDPFETSSKPITISFVSFDLSQSLTGIKGLSEAKVERSARPPRSSW